jgi:hypothetical protein
MRLIWSYSEKVLLRPSHPQTNQFRCDQSRYPQAQAKNNSNNTHFVVKPDAGEYLRDGSCLSLGPLETGSLRSDFTSCGSALSALCPRAAAAAAIASPALCRLVGS